MAKGLLSRASEPMSKVDTAWLRMETPTNLMMITGVMMFDQRMDIRRFKRILAERFLAYRRFRQKAVDKPSGASWETDRDFDLDWHVRMTALPGAAYTFHMSLEVSSEAFFSLVSRNRLPLISMSAPGKRFAPRVTSLPL